MTRQRGEQQHARLIDVRRLGKSQQRAEGRTADRFLVDRDPAAADLDGLDRERPARVAQRGERRDLRAGKRRPRQRPVEQRIRERPQDLATGDRQRSPRRQQVLLRLIGLVKHGHRRPQHVG